jgi:hypothetical protein
MMLKEEIEAAKRTVNTDTVQITLGEVANMYAASELNILPEFQRLFRWPPERKSNFVESILIGIPVPPVFVFENADGTWELIDGLQRISTVLEFMGVLHDPDTGEHKRSVLMKTKYLPSLDSVAWQAQQQNERTLDKALQLFFRRARMDFQILKHPSDPKTKFDLFQRLNRGGAYATEQEVRTCSMVLADPEFTRRIRQFAENDDFKRMFRISEDQHKSQKDIEYLVRLIVHTEVNFERGLDVQEFLNHGVLEVISREDSDELLDSAAWVLETLNRVLGENAWIPPEDRAEGIAARFSLRALEGIAVGVARNKEGISALDDTDAFVRTRVEDFWRQQEVVEMSATGLRGTVRLQRSIPFGEAWFNPNA